MKNQVTKRQHWNPRMLLRHFARNGKIKERILLRRFTSFNRII